jgi:anti-sigma regulatory factor (Ser/Thr protein kinase)
MDRRRSFPLHAHSVGSARHFVVETLLDMGFEPWPADLVVTELATNALRHAGTPFTVSVTVDGQVTIEVSDGSGAVPAPRESASDEDGRGLQLVDALVLDWGVDVADATKSVWCRLALQPAGGSTVPTRSAAVVT